MQGRSAQDGIAGAMNLIHKEIAFLDSKTIKCNFCGKEMDDFDVLSDFTIAKKIGYGSIHDGETVDFRMCCVCFDRVTHACVISPFIEDGDDDA